MELPWGTDLKLISVYSKCWYFAHLFDTGEHFWPSFELLWLTRCGSVLIPIFINLLVFSTTFALIAIC